MFRYLCWTTRRRKIIVLECAAHHRVACLNVTWLCWGSVGRDRGRDLSSEHCWRYITFTSAHSCWRSSILRNVHVLQRVIMQCGDRNVDFSWSVICPEQSMLGKWSKFSPSYDVTASRWRSSRSAAKKCLSRERETCGGEMRGKCSSESDSGIPHLLINRIH